MLSRHFTTLVALALSGTATGGTFNVPGDYPTIQAAISALGDDDVIVVAPGTYVETIDFLGKNLTVRSSGGPDATVIDGGGLDTVVTFEDNETANAKLIGFTITNGHGPDGSAPARGGGIHCARDTQPTIENCRIVGNQGSAGAPFVMAGAGGIHCRESGPSIRGCIVEGNTGGQAADQPDSSAGAGGIHSWGRSTIVIAPEIEDCVVRGNAGGGAGDAGSLTAGAGGIFVFKSPARVIRCLIEDIIGGACGRGDSDVGGAGGIAVQNDVLGGATTEILRCTIRGNQGGGDGPGSGSGGAGGVDLSSDAWPKISNCVLYDNVGGTSGTTDGDRGAAGGLSCRGVNGEDPLVMNCTIVNNTGGLAGVVGGGSGGIASHISNRLQVVNSIVWGNTGAGVAPDNIGSWAGTNPRVVFSVVEGGWSGEGNMDSDPLLTNVSGGDLHPRCGSPSIDTGTNFDNGIFAPSDDLDGKLRSDGFIDIGAYEYGPRAENYCIAAPNSFSQGAIMGFVGSTSIARNDFGLRADCTPNTPGLFFYGPNQIQVTFGDGFRCVGGAVKRLPPSGAMNHALTRSLNLPNTSIVEGTTWNFQAWFRDPGAGGAGFNTSDAISISFVQ